MARYARVMSMETWNRQNGEDEAGFEGRRRRRRKQRRKERRQGKGQRRPQRQERQSGGQGYPEEGAPAERTRAQAPQAQQAPDFVYDEVPEDDDPEPEGDFGAPVRRGRTGARQGRQGGGRGLFAPREGREAGQRRGLLQKGAGKRLREGLAPPWSPAIALGPNLKMKARKGFRAAVVEVKPGLFVVAEVPERSVEFGLGPLLLAPALVKTLGRAFRRGQAGQGQPGVQQQSASPPPALPAPPARPALPGPTAEDDRLARWLDDDIAAELGCRACERRS